MPQRESTITLLWPAGSAQALEATTPRSDVLDEAVDDDGSFSQAHGPFHSYRRTAEIAPNGDLTETAGFRC